MSRNTDKSEGSRSPSLSETDRSRLHSVAEINARWNAEVPAPAAISRRTEPQPSTSVAARPETSRVSGLLSRLAASFDEPYTPYSGASSGADISLAKDGAYLPKQDQVRPPTSYDYFSHKRGSDASIKQTESLSSEIAGLTNSADLVNANTFALRTQKSTNSSQDQSGSGRDRPRLPSEERQEHKQEKLNSSRSHSNTSSTSVLVQQQNKHGHHVHRHHDQGQARESRSRDKPASRSSRRDVRDHNFRAQDERNNNAARSRHSSREMVKFDSSSNVKFKGSPKSSARSSRHASQTRASKSSSRHSSVSRHSREMLTLPPGFSESGVLERSGSLGSESEESLEPGARKSAIISFNLAVHRRTTALSMAILTLALLSGSASQLRFMMAYASAHQYPELNYFLICMSIVIEVIAGTGYVILSRFDFSEECVERTHSYLIFGIFLIAVSNVIISAFALDDHVCELEVMQKTDMDYIDQNPPNPDPSPPSL